mmetsp:Transcript_18483/g.31743  ORF Transcript_18483/g.31743 Transcript_18483/m.31743 type:complete len:287 (-) Transcript_18483:16-876(-)
MMPIDATNNQHIQLADGYVLLPSTMDNEGTFGCITAMLKQEESIMCHDYFNIVKKDARDAISRRSEMCSLIFRTANYAKLRSETAIVAMNYLDRFLCGNSSSRAKMATNDPRKYQLIAITSLFIAIKVTEPIKVDDAIIIHLSKGLRSAKDIASCEHEILTALRWKLQGPTPFQFIGSILELLPDSVRTVEMAKRIYYYSLRQIKHAMEDYAFIILRRSSIAIASILNSLDEIDEDDFPSSERTQFVQKISQAFDVDIASPLIRAIKKRLLKKSKSLRACRIIPCA